jgi:putative addiction module component (TIGR02574 family)
MTKPARELESRALKLPRRERARLAQRLISSLDPYVDANVDKLWLQEADPRLAELKSGKVAGIPVEKVLTGKSRRSRPAAVSETFRDCAGSTVEVDGGS